MSIKTDLELAYAIGYDDALAKLKPDRSRAHELGYATCRNAEPYQLPWSFTCSECGVHSITQAERFNYCPFCGRRVEEGDDEQSRTHHD